MGSLHDLVGDLVDLVPPLNVNPGTVLLTFRHGAPVDVIKPGKKLRRGRGLPLTMAPQGVPISTADIPIDVEVSSIALPGPYGLPRLEARLVISINDRDDFTALKRYVQRKGLNFAQLLDGEVSDEFDRRVRQALGGYEHVQLHRMGNLSALIDANTPLLDGLFRIESVQHVTASWHPEFVRAQEAMASKAREAAEMLLEHETTPLRLQAAEDEDLVVLERAARRGLSMVEFENPELLGAEEQRRHELQVEIIRNADALRRIGGGDTVAEAMRSVVHSVDTPLAGLTAGPDGDSTTQPTQVVDPIDRLKRDAVLLRLWRASGLPGEPTGVGLGEKVLLAVYEGQVSAEHRRQLIDTIGSKVDASEVVTIDQAASIEDVVRRYLQERVPELASNDVTMALAVVGSSLIITLASSLVRLSPLLSRIKDPAADVLAPLAAVLPYDVVDVTVKGGG